MGYFPNGSEGESYEHRYCRRCIHNVEPEDGSCAVWLAHLLYNGQPEQEAVLNLLIPVTPDGVDNQQCAMFTPTPAAP